MKRSKPGHRQRQPLVFITMSYLSLLMVIVVLGTSMFFVSLDVQMTQTANANRMVLEQIAVRLESSLNEANYYAYSINRLSSVQKLMLAQRPLTTQNIYTIREASRDISTFEDSNSLVEGCQVYLSSSDVLLEVGNAFLNIDRMYGKSFSYGAMSLQEWRNHVLESRTGSAFYPAASALVGGRQAPMMLYTRRLSHFSSPTGKVIFYLNAQALQKLFEPLSSLSSGCALLMSSSGEVLVSSSPVPPSVTWGMLEQASNSSFAETTIDGNRCLLFSHSLPAFGLRTAAIIPYSAVINQTSHVLKPMLICIGVLTLIGLILTFYHIRTTKRPLVRIMELLSSNGSSFDRKTLGNLNQAVHQLVSSHNLLQSRLEEQRLELRAAVVASLESGETLENRELKMLLSHVGVQPEGNRFRGVYLVLRGGSDDLNAQELTRSDVIRALVAELLAPYAPQIIFLSLKDHTSFILLYAEDASSSTDLQAFFSRLYDDCHSLLGQEMTFFVGTECRKLCYLPHSLLAARQLMLMEEPIAFLAIADESQLPGDPYVYSDQHEKKLISLAHQSKDTELYALLDELYEANTQRNLSRFNRQLLYYRMVGTLSNMPQRPEIPEELTLSLDRLPMDEFFVLLKKCYTSVCVSNQERHTAYSEKLLSDIIAFLRENCTDPNLSLSSTAIHFGITEKYLSSFIHEKSGINFLSYVDQMRIQKAEELLHSTSLTIDDISQKVGYSSVKTFRRAYGRVTGITPSESRKMKSGAK